MSAARPLIFLLLFSASCLSAQSDLKSSDLIDSERQIYCLTYERKLGLDAQLARLKQDTLVKTRKKRWQRKFKAQADRLLILAERARSRQEFERAAALEAEARLQFEKVSSIERCFSGGGLELAQDSCQILGGSLTNEFLKPIIHGAICPSDSSPVLKLSFLGRRCSASLFQISDGKYWVISAAHCFAGLALQAADVEIQHSSGVYKAEQIFVHPDYRLSSKPLALFDLAILRFPTLFTSQVLPLAFDARSLKGRRVYIAGFGIYGDQTGLAGSFDNQLRAAQAIVSRVTDSFISFPYDQESYARGFGNTCSGDSGSPLVYCTGSSLQSCSNYGVLSNGRKPFCDFQDVSRYSNLSLAANREFIERTLGQ